VKYGVCTWIFGDESLAETAARLAAIGYDGVELFGDLERYKAREVRSLLNDNGLAVLSLTPDNVDLAHPELAVQRRAIDYYFRLLDLAAELGQPVVSCHGAVGRIRALSEYGEEWAILVKGVRRIAERAQQAGLRIAVEVLNRYESHLINTADQAVRFVGQVGSPNVGVLLDAYHMNIEEADLRSALHSAREHLYLFHAADSNRQGVGCGHTNFVGIMRTLRDIGYDGSIILECTAPGPDPFTPVKGPAWRQEVWGYVNDSIRVLRLYENLIGAHA